MTLYVDGSLLLWPVVWPVGPSSFSETLIYSIIVTYRCRFWRLQRIDASLRQAFEPEFDWLHEQQMRRYAVDLSCIDQLQMKDLRKCALYSHGSYALAPVFAAFTVPHAVWQEVKDSAFGEFLVHQQSSRNEQWITSSNSVLTMPARPNIARKPVQRKPTCAVRARQQ